MYACADVRMCVCVFALCCVFCASTYFIAICKWSKFKWVSYPLLFRSRFCFATNRSIKRLADIKERERDLRWIVSIRQCQIKVLYWPTARLYREKKRNKELFVDLVFWFRKLFQTPKWNKEEKKQWRRYQSKSHCYEHISLICNHIKYRYT